MASWMKKQGKNRSKRKRPSAQKWNCARPLKDSLKFREERWGRTSLSFCRQSPGKAALGLPRVRTRDVESRIGWVISLRPGLLRTSAGALFFSAFPGKQQRTLLGLSAGASICIFPPNRRKSPIEKHVGISTRLFHLLPIQFGFKGAISVKKKPVYFGLDYNKSSKKARLE